MGFFYFDESIHERGNFILGAFVYSNSDITPIIHEKISSVRLKPGIDEFKSSYLMKNGGIYHELRGVLRSFFSKVKIGMIIISPAERVCLGNHVLSGLNKILLSNNLSQVNHDVYLDEGIPFSSKEKSIGEFTSKYGVNIHLDQDSRAIAGIQLADLAAHTLSVMLLESIGLVDKKVKITGDPVYEDVSLELGFELWAGLRYSLFSQAEITIEAIERDPVNAFLIDTGSYCLYISDGCTEQVKEAAESRFGLNYVGCIH